MKKIITLVAALVIGMTSILSAETYGKQNLLGVNPLGVLFNVYSGEYGRFLDEKGSSEINIPFYATLWDSMNAYGLGIKYRMYKDENGEGLFYGGGISGDYVTWDYLTYNASFALVTETMNWMTIKPLVEIGYRWTWESGFTIAPSFDIGYMYSTYETNSDATLQPTTGISGISWGFGLGLAFMF